MSVCKHIIEHSILGVKSAAKTVEFLGAITNEPTGFPNRTDSTISFVDGTRTFTIAPAVTSFDYYILGKKYKVSAADPIVIDDTEGLHFIYYDDDTLTDAINPTDTDISSVIRTKALVSILYWDATNNEGIYIGEERHGVTMDGVTHDYLHFINGLAYLTGLALNSILVDQSGALDSHAQFGVDAGNVADEDIFEMVSAVTSTTGLPVYYREGASGDWRKTTNAGFSITTTGTGRMAWNEFTGGAWQLTEVTNTKYALCHIFATTEKDTPMIAMAGQAEYSNQATARLGATTEIGNLLLGNLPTPEIRPIASVIFQTADSYGNAVKSRIRSTDEGADYVDFRTSDITRTAAGGDHGSLSGLGDDDHSQYLLLAGRGPQSITDDIDITGSLDVDNLNFDGNTIISTDTNGDIILDPNGTGKVGIGTDAPGTILEVKDGTITVTPGYGIFSNPASGNATGFNFATNIIQGFTSNQERFRIASDGNVGIGITDPGVYKLYVNGNQNINGTLTATAVNATTFTGALTGNADTATALATARDIGGVSFDGTASIVPTTIVVADTTDTTCYVGLWESATGSLLPKTDAGITYNAGTGALVATSLSDGTATLTSNTLTVTNINAFSLGGKLTGGANEIEGSNFDINGGTIDGVTLGTNSAVTEAQIDNININGNTLSSTDTNGNINIVPNGTGQVLKSSQCYFNAYLSSSQINKTGDGTVYTVIFNTENYDRNSDYNAATGIFTAPVDGVYFFASNVRISGMTSSHVRFYIRLTTSKGNNFGVEVNPWNVRETSFNRVCLSVSSLKYLEAGDTAKIDISVAGSSKVVDMVGTISDYNNFTGGLMY